MQQTKLLYTAKPTNPCSAYPLQSHHAPISKFFNHSYPSSRMNMMIDEIALEFQKQIWNPAIFVVPMLTLIIIIQTLRLSVDSQSNQERLQTNTIPGNNITNYATYCSSIDHHSTTSHQTKLFWQSDKLQSCGTSKPTQNTLPDHAE